MGLIKRLGRILGVRPRSPYSEVEQGKMMSDSKLPAGEEQAIADANLKSDAIQAHEDETYDLSAEFDDENAFPRMVYRKGTTVKVEDGLEVDFIIVGNKPALVNALTHGYFLTPQEAGEAEEDEEDDEGRKVVNPRPNEPDNAPFQNTSYADPQTGDLPDPPTSPAEQVDKPLPIPPEEAETDVSRNQRTEAGEQAEEEIGGAMVEESEDDDEDDDAGVKRTAKRSPGRPATKGKK